MYDNYIWFGRILMRFFSRCNHIWCEKKFLKNYAEKCKNKGLSKNFWNYDCPIISDLGSPLYIFGRCHFVWNRNSYKKKSVQSSFSNLWKTELSAWVGIILLNIFFLRMIKECQETTFASFKPGPFNICTVSPGLVLKFEEKTVSAEKIQSCWWMHYLKLFWFHRLIVRIKSCK